MAIFRQIGCKSIGRRGKDICQLDLLAESLSKALGDYVHLPAVYSTAISARSLASLRPNKPISSPSHHPFSFPSSPPSRSFLPPTGISPSSKRLAPQIQKLHSPSLKIDQEGTPPSPPTPSLPSPTHSRPSSCGSIRLILTCKGCDIELDSNPTITKLMDIEADKKSAYLDEYRILRTLGAGYHAEVKLGVDDHGQQVAIKKYKKETATLETLKHELGVMKQLEHENLVRLLSVRENATYKAEDESTSNCFAIVLEFVGGGELFDFVAETGKFSEKVARTYFHQMMNGLHYMHQKGYAHRDIKPENLLLSHLFILKIADFGFSCLIKGKDGTGVLRTKLGTEGYMAPEIPNKKYEGKSVDIFASGVILFIMYAGNPPFEKATPTDPYYKILKEKKYDIFWKAHSRKRPVGFFSDSFKDLFQRLVAFDPAERPRIQEIAAHSWIKESVCTHGEIKEEFVQRQKKLDAVLNDRRAEMEKQRQQKVTAVSAQGSAHRGGSEVSQTFISLYNKEFHTNRALPTLEITSKDDLLRTEQPAMAVALLKEFLPTHEIKLADDEEEELIGDETDVLRFTQILDDGGNRLGLVYGYSFEIDEQQFEGKVELQVQLGLTANKELVVKFDRVEGDLIYYKKIVQDLRQKCFL